MAALTQDRSTRKFGTDNLVDPVLLSFPVAAGSVPSPTTLYGGAMLAINASGFAVTASADPTLKIWGRIEKQVSNTSSAGAVRVDCRQGAFGFDNSTGADLIQTQHLGELCFVSDDHTVALTDGGGSRPAAGIVMYIDPISGQVYVQLGASSLYRTNPGASSGSSGSSIPYAARGVGPASNVASLAAFTVAGNDGITYVAGDVVFLYAQTTASQNGPYVVGTVTTGTAPLTRPDWYATGSTQSVARNYTFGTEGTLYSGASFKPTFAGSSYVVDTANPAFFPLRVSQQITLAAGTATIANVPIRLANRVGVFFTRITPANATTTVTYAPATITPGQIGTVSLVVNAQVAAGTIQNTDTSVLNVEITNW